MIEYEELPEDYLVTYRNNINNVNIEDVGRVADEYLDPEKAIILIVGNDTVYKEISSVFPEIGKIDRP
jgi:predicted Zn-dependent peptidase